MAAGLPVVVPQIGGPATYVENAVTGMVVDTTDLSVIAVGLRLALGLAQDPMTAVRTRNVVEQRFTLVHGNVARHLAADSEAQLRARAVLVAALEDPATGAAQAEALKP